MMIHWSIHVNLKALAGTLSFFIVFNSTMSSGQVGPGQAVPSEISSSTSAQVLSEEKLLSEFRAHSVSRLRESSGKFQTELNASLMEEIYQARAKSSYNFQRSDEKAKNRFQPVISPNEDWSVGIEKKIPLGAKLGLDIFGNQSSASDQSFQDATQIGGRLSLELDLWKNIAGRLDRANLSSADAQKKRAHAQYEINVKKREIEIRKVYWSLVATHQSIHSAKQLLESAERQLKEALQRQNAGVADRGEIARYRAQVDSRNASLILFEYESELQFRIFKNEFKNFEPSHWIIDLKEIETTQKTISACLAKLTQQNEFSPEHTRYDEVISLLKEETQSELRAAKLHDKFNLALFTQFQTTGVDTDYRRARDDQNREKRGGYAASLQLSIPLGSAAEDSKHALQLFKKNLLESQSAGLENELSAQHDLTVKSLDLLQRGLKNQVQNSQNLDVNYQEVLRKFRQGRIPVSTVIIEQDALFQSQLQEINLKKQIAHLVLDYFSIFGQFPCEWNQI